MTRLAPRAPIIGLSLAVALAAGATANAQGTDEQREACAPDAVKLCQATIPDIPKTTACMKAHFAELSPRCKVAFNAVTGGGDAPRKSAAAPARREAVAPPPAPATGGDDMVVEAPERVPGLRGYEAQIRGYCRDGLIDPFTCRNTLAALHGME